MIERCCLACGCKFMTYPSIAKRPTGGRYCSNKCKDTHHGKTLRGIRLVANKICFKPNHCEMLIVTKNRGHFIILFDTDDYDKINKYTWNVNRGGYVRSSKMIGMKRSILLHRLIMDTPPNMDTDHINHNTLDNRKANLRICTKTQNQINASKRKGRKYKGVFKIWNGKYMAKVGNLYLGTFDKEYDAAIAYDTKAKELFGDFVILNINNQHDNKLIQ